MGRRDAVRAKSVSDAIDRQLKEDSIKLRKQAKVLLLGNDPSQSAIVRNMELFNQCGLTDEELMSYRPTIYQNTLDSAQALIRHMRHIGLGLHPANSVNADRILDYRVDNTAFFVFSPEIAQAIHGLLQDPATASVMEHRREFLSDNAIHFLKNILVIGSPNYHPTEGDVLRTRVKTRGLAETHLTMDRLRITIIDISGVCCDRRKWIHCFEGVTTILICVPLSDYDWIPGDDRSQTRLHDSLTVFESVVNSQWFKRTSIVLFLTDVDGFKEKLTRVPFERYFPDYTGGPDVNKAAKYILWRFMQLNRARLAVYPHLARVTDKSNQRLLFASVKETILQNSLRLCAKREPRRGVLRRLLGLLVPKLGRYLASRRIPMTGRE